MKDLIASVSILFRQDIRFLHRQGLLYLYAFLTLLYSLTLWLLPAPTEQLLFPLFLLSDPAMMGFFFSAAMIYLEVDQGVLSPLFTAPPGPVPYLIARCLSLLAIALTMSLAVSLVHRGFHWSLFTLLLGMSLSSILFTLMGILLSLSFKSFTSFLMLGGFLELPLVLPLAHSFGWWDHWSLGLLPTWGTLYLIGTFQQQNLSAGAFLQSLAVLSIPLVILFVVTLKQLRIVLLRRDG